MGYKKSEITNRLNGINKLENLYVEKMINYTGNTTDTKEKYTEVIAKEILDNFNKFDFNNINVIKRDKGYNVDTHDGKFNKDSNRREELIAMKLFNTTYEGLGKFIDYQIPLKDKKNTKAGKIDLISYCEEENTLYLIELKNDFSKETLLRCVLEIMTYINQVDKEKLVVDYNMESNVKIKPAILIFEGTRPHKDISDKYVAELIKKFGIALYIANIDEKFNIKSI